MGMEKKGNLHETMANRAGGPNFAHRFGGVHCLGGLGDRTRPCGQWLALAALYRFIADLDLARVKAVQMDAQRP